MSSIFDDPTGSDSSVGTKVEGTGFMSFVAAGFNGSLELGVGMNSLILG